MRTNIKAFRLSVLLAATLAAAALAQGCALLLLGGVAAGAAYGTVKYVDNSLRVTEEVSLDKAWAAANGALKELKMPVTSSAKDGGSGKLEARNAQDQPVTIQTIRKTDSVTEIQITVGTFDNSANRTEAQQIYDRMKARFSAGTPVGERQNRALNRASLIKSISASIFPFMTGVETHGHSERALESRGACVNERVTLRSMARRQTGANKRRCAVCQ